MKELNRHRIGTLIVLAVLLAGITMGNFTICDMYAGTFEEVAPIVVNLKAGETAAAIAGGPRPGSYRFSLCGTVPEGVYNRVYRLSGTAYVDLVTTTATPPGHYSIDYVEGGIDVSIVRLGLVDLTVLEPDHALTACFNVFVDGPILVNQHVNFTAYCSSAPVGQRIVQYKWWFDYSGGPTSLPSATTSEFQIDHAYATAGQRTVRLVVVSDNGDEAATAHSINVVAP